MFIPTTPEEIQKLGWDRLDVVLVTGDSYIDSPFIGVAVIGKVLLAAGFRVGIIAQPDVNSPANITRLGEPLLFWGVSGGSIDSMVANTTPTRKRRHQDDYTPGGENNRRPDRAALVYTNLIRRFYKNTRPIVLGGIEASLRRVAHYDYWSDRIRPSILFDAKADLLLYGMAEKSVLELAQKLRAGEDIHAIRGLCYIAKEKPENYLELPDFQTASTDKKAFIELFHTFYRNNDPLSAQGLCQRQDTRWWVQNPPAALMTQPELDAVYALDYERAQHPYYEKMGKVRALETIQFSISTHRGCYGECSFCAIAVHEGRTIQWRSEESILAEARKLAASPNFKGYIQDVGGPTANMYAIECPKKLKSGACPEKSCLYPNLCPVLKIDHARQLDLLRKIRKVPGVKKAFVASGIRYDMLLGDLQHGRQYLQEMVEHHTSGQMKVAPEHTEDRVLGLMGKPGSKSLLKFKDAFDGLSEQARKKQFLTYYFIAAHPGCTEDDMRRLKHFASSKLHLNPEQVQIFTPTPSTYASLMYYTEMNPFTGEKLFVEKDLARKEKQKGILTEKNEIRKSRVENRKN